MLVPLVGLLALNLFLALPMGKNFVAKKVSGAVHFPVTVGAATYTPWGGFRVKDLRIEQVEAARSVVDDPFFSAVSFEADVDLLSLLRSEVVIDRLVCDSPEISIVRRPEQKRVVTGEKITAVTPKPEPKPGVGNPKPTPSKAPTTPTPSPVVVKKVAPVKKSRRTVSVRQVEIRRGSLRFTSFEGDELIRVDGLRMTVDLTSGDGGGELRIDEAWLAGLLKVTDFTSPIEVDGKQLKLTGVDASCGGGAVGGEIVITRRSGHAPFVAKLTASEIDLVKLVDGKSFGLKSGIVGAKLALRGTLEIPKSYTGGGRFWVDSATLESGSEFEKLRSAMQVDRDGSVTIDTAEAEFAIKSGVVAVRKANFGSGRLLLKSIGGVRMDGALNVATRVYLGGDLYSAVRSKPVLGRPELAFSRLEGTDWYYRDELLTGSVTQPRLDFWRTGELVAPGEIMEELIFDLPDPNDPIGK